MTGLEFLNKEARKLAKKCAEARRCVEVGCFLSYQIFNPALQNLLLIHNAVSIGSDGSEVLIEITFEDNYKICKWFETGRSENAFMED